MKRRRLRKILLTLAVLAGAAGMASTATAADPPWNIDYTGTCGDGVIDVAVATEADKIEAGGPFYKPYKTRNGYSPYGNALNTIDPPTTEHWPYLTTDPKTTRGEMCDGTSHTVLCYPATGTDKRAVNSRCTIINNATELKTHPSSGIEIDSCYLDGDPAKNIPATCGPGVGNGIIQPADPFKEQCDDGNIDAGDGCSPTGQFEKTIGSRSGCGNGVYEPTDGEDCDDGNTRDGDGCEHDCKWPKGAQPSFCNNNTDTCGDGKVQPHLDEQCDDGKDNGKESSSCTEDCQLKGSPNFTLANYAYWTPNGDDVRLDTYSNGSGGSKVVFLDTSLSICRTEGGQYPCIGSPSVKIGPYGNIITLGHAPNMQLSGVFLSGQKLEDINNTDIYPNQKIKLNMVVSPTTTSGGQWDDDALGLVIGMKEGNQSQYGTDYKYLMLSWRSYVPAGWGRDIDYASNGTTEVKAAPPGLRLYQIKGAPNYLELWSMDNNDHIEEIKTWGTGNLNKGPFVNPFINLSTTYALNFSYGNAQEDQRLQIDLEFTADELIVYVNRQPAIYIERVTLEGEGYTWPKEGQLGYYILGMDNITADFRGYDARTEAKAVVAAGEKKAGGKTTVCSGFCGDMNKDDGEDCDDGNKVDGDGCDSDCKFTNKTEVCKDVEDDGSVERLCFGGEILSPANGQQVTNKPTIKGSYVGNPAEIKVDVTDENGAVVCFGTATKSENKLEGSPPVPTITYNQWEFDMASCPNLSEQTYTVEATFVPTQSPQGNTFEPIKSKTTFKYVTSITRPQVTIDSPLSSDIYVVDNATPIRLSGSCESANEVKIETCNGTTCQSVLNPPSPITCDPISQRWSATIIDLGADGDNCLASGQCELKVTAVNTNTNDTSTPAKRDLVKVPTPPTKVTGEVTITNINSGIGKGYLDNNKISLNPGDTITVEGTVTVPDECKTNINSSCAPEFVEIVYNCPNGKYNIKEDTVVTQVNAEGKYSVELPIKYCLGAQNSDIKATAYSKIGNRAVKINDSPEKIYLLASRNSTNVLVFIQCPRAGTPINDCSSNGTAVKGYINANTPKNVIVSYYKRDSEDEKCNFAEAAKTEGKVKTKTVVTDDQGQWYAKLDDLKPGYYCVEGKTKTLETKDGYSTDVVPTYVALTAPDKVVFQDNENGQATFRVPAPKGGNLQEGDTCEIRYGTTDKTSTYKLVDGELICVVEGAPIPTNKDKVLVRNTRKNAPTSTWTPVKPIVAIGGPAKGSHINGNAKDKKGSIVYTTGGTIIVDKLSGFKKDDIIYITTFGEDNKPQLGQKNLPCKVDITGTRCTYQLPPNFKEPKKITATDKKSGKPVDTWFAKPSKQDSYKPIFKDTVQPTVSYVDNESGSDAAKDHVDITIPKVGVGDDINEGDTIKITGPGNATGQCTIESVDGEVIKCRTEKAFLMDNGDRVPSGAKVAISKIDPGDALAIGTAYLYDGMGSPSGPGQGPREAGGDQDDSGFVAGGCSSTDTPESGLLALLLAALGFFAIRRRRD